MVVTPMERKPRANSSSQGRFLEEVCVCAYVCVYTPLYVGKPKYYLFLNIHIPSVIYPI